MEFECVGSTDAKLQFTPYIRNRLRQYLVENGPARLKIVPILPESSKLRGFYEGGVVGLVACYQEGMDHRNSDDCRKVREWLKEEFNGEMVEIGGKLHTIGKSTKGREVLNAFVERVIDWVTENYQPPVEALNPEKYKHWRDTVYPFGGPDTYIDYLISLNILKPYEAN